MSPSTPLKQAALDFLQLAASGEVREAYRKHVAATFRHHNPFFAGDAESLMRGMEDNAAQHPHKVFEVRHALEDGEWVAVHSRVAMQAGDLGVAVVHLFRFENDRIAELWDVGQPVLPQSPNQHGMF